MTMSEPRPQHLKNHASIDPMFHYVALGLLLFGLILGVAVFVQSLHKDTDLLIGLWMLLVSVVLIVIAFKARIYPLKVQDRVIRLEERLRLAMLLSETMRHRIHELTEDQLIGLPFASDDEVPELVHEALEKKLNRQQIKERIQNWRADHFRV